MKNFTYIYGKIKRPKDAYKISCTFPKTRLKHSRWTKVRVERPLTFIGKSQRDYCITIFLLGFYRLCEHINFFVHKHFFGISIYCGQYLNADNSLDVCYVDSNDFNSKILLYFYI